MTISILVVDDEAEIRDMLSRHFRYRGYYVDVAANGEEALRKMEAQKTDIVISDILMPVMDGPELCRRIRQDYPLTRVIIITGHVTLDNAMTCLRRGAETCVFKPIEKMEELDEAVDRAVDTIKRWVKILNELRGMSALGGEHD